MKRLCYYLLLLMLLDCYGYAEEEERFSLNTIVQAYQRYDTAKNEEKLPNLLGLKIYEEMAKNNLDVAETLLKTDAKDNAHTAINHWWLANIALSQKKYAEVRKHISKAKALPFLKNTKLAAEFYRALPASQHSWFVKEIASTGYFETPSASACPYFELKKRKDRADFLYLMAKDNRLDRKEKAEVFRELYVVMSETINEEALSQLNGFDAYKKSVPTTDLAKRMENLLVFGKNTEARSTYEAKISQKKPELTKAELCELEYIDAKVDRKLRKYDIARARFKKLFTDCPDETKVKARYLDLMLAAQRSDDTALPLFSAFVEQYKDHSFSDDVLLFKANLLLDKGHLEEALATLEQIIQQYPKGDMIERALFLKGFQLAKNGDTKGALLSFQQLEKATVDGQLERAQAQYWIARLTLFPDLYRLDNPQKNNLPTTKKAFERLVNLPSPNVYSWLSYGLLTHLGAKVLLPSQSPEGKTEVIRKEKNLELDQLENLVMRGFRKEALALLEDIEVSNQNKDHGLRVAQLFDAVNQPSAGHQKLVRCNFAFAQTLKKEAPSIYRKISYPRPFSKEVSFAVAKVDVPEDIIFAIMRQESGFIPESVSWAGAKGLMQVMFASAVGQASVWGIKNLQESDLFLPDVNVLLASSILQNYWQQFGSVVVGLAAYNAGPNMAKAWLGKNRGGSLDTFVEEISFKETRDYVKSVLGNIFAYTLYSSDRSSLGLSFKQFAAIK